MRTTIFRIALLGAAIGLPPATAVGARVAGSVATTAAASTAATGLNASVTGLSASAWTDTSIGAIDTEVFALALNAAACAVQSGDVEAPSTLTVIDYSRPSTEKRLWIYDLRSPHLLYEELVSHGQGSGANVPTKFSNEPETHTSSIGLFATDDTYVGRNGYSLRLNGLDAGFNDRARERAIVMHGAPYVSAAYAKSRGRLGRSWGCPALRADIAREVIDQVKGSGLVFAYYPDPAWLKKSKYLGNCAPAA